MSTMAMSGLNRSPFSTAWPAMPLNDGQIHFQHSKALCNCFVQQARHPAPLFVLEPHQLSRKTPQCVIGVLQIGGSFFFPPFEWLMNFLKAFFSSPSPPGLIAVYSCFAPR